MSARKTRGARRPSARRGPAGNPGAKTTQAGADSSPAPKSTSKRISARRGTASSPPDAAEESRSGLPAAPASQAGPEAPAAAKPRARARSRKADRVQAAAPEAAEPGVERESPGLPAESAKPLDDVPAALPQLARAVPATPAKSSTSMPAKSAPPAFKPSIGPPGVQVSEDVWETVGEGPPLLSEWDAAPGRASALASMESAGASPEQGGARTAHLTASSRVAGPRDEDGLGSAQAVLGSDYYYQQWGRGGLRRLEADVDGFGLDPHFEARLRPWLSNLCRYYFRVEVTGTENLPADGRALLIANRSGVVPWDGLVLKEALRSSAPTLPALRWLAEDSVFYYPFLGVFMNRMGAVRACPENAERLLRQSSLVAVFPEGARGAGKLFRERYQLQRFGRGGYVRLALRNRAPVIPVAIVGGEDAYPLLARSKLLGKLFGSRYAPVTPTFPLLGPAGLLPAPVKWRVVVGEPLDLSDYDPEAAEDALVVHRVNERVRGNLQSLVKRSVRDRGNALI